MRFMLCRLGSVTASIFDRREPITPHVRARKHHDPKLKLDGVRPPFRCCDRGRDCNG